MCGIAGWFSDSESIIDKAEIFGRMSAALCRRGPDEHGEFVSRRAAMLHRRLTVIDPETGRQPMIFSKRGADKNVVLIYNGELYNTDELRAELAGAGYDFKGHSDTEVLLKAYLHWGEKCPEKLNGIFAFAVYDEAEHSLFMARDPIGVKPFFYYSYGGGLIFGSEIKALLQNQIVKPQIDQQGLMEIFFLGPGRTPGCGVFRNVSELLPGECAVYRDATLSKRRYFKVAAEEHRDDERTTIERTRYLITDAIKRQLVSDVPLCTFLSGGLDSSIISHAAAEHFRSRGKKLTTYSVNYADNARYFKKSLFQPNSDEEYISVMTRFTDSEHHEIVLGNEALYKALFEAVDARDTPGMTDVDSSLLLFCREVRKDFTVAVSGECADELFGGYPWYHSEEILNEDCFPWSRSTAVRRAILRKGILKRGEEYVRERYEQTLRDTDCLPGDSPIQRRRREMFMLNIGWFMQTLLDRKDRCSMYSGLEVRVPFCDKRIVSYAYNMPWELKALGGREKGIVRKAFSDVLPESIVWRKKSPYPKTHNPIYTKLCAEGAKRILDDRMSPLRELLNADGVRELIDRPDSLDQPWYGQLMRTPQILAYIAQVDYWMRKYSVEIVGSID